MTCKKPYFETDPFAEGTDAYLAGHPESANPYDVDDDAHLEWNGGWIIMQEAETHDT